MAYVTSAQVQACIAVNDFNAAFDDTNSQNPATITANFNTAASLASTMVDSYLASIYDVPFITEIPPLCQSAALAFICEMVYRKRYTPDQMNPWKPLADDYREKLENIRKTGSGLDHLIDRDFQPGFVVTGPITFNGPSL